MYGQKQILQCLAIAIVLAVFNFHRSAINRNKESTKRIATRPSVVAPILTEKQANQTGYCIRNPFGTNRLANFESWISCHYVCFDKFDTWLRTQCTANCCVNKTVTPKCPPFSAQLKSVMQTTRNRENALTKSASIGARQQDKRIPVEHVIETSIYQKINGGKYKLAEEHECKIQTDNEHICSNTTSGNGNIVTLEQNETQLIMEYHEFLFNAESLKPGVVSHSHHGAKSSILFALFSIIMAMITAKYLYKLFVTDHNQAVVRAMELRRIIQARIDEINADMARTREMAEEKEKARKNQENADVADENTEANESNAVKTTDDEIAALAPDTTHDDPDVNEKILEKLD